MDGLCYRILILLLVQRICEKNVNYFDPGSHIDSHVLYFQGNVSEEELLKAMGGLGVEKGAKGCWVHACLGF